MAEFAIDTQRLVLRGWRQDDHAAFLAMCRDPAVMEHLGPLQSAADIDATIARQQALQAAHGHCFWAVERRDDRAMVGFCGLKPGPADTPLEGRMEIGWRLATHVWGKGYAREAAQASLEWGFAHLASTSDVDASDGRIWAMTVPGNTRSWGLMERLGMTRHPDLDFDHPALPADSPLLRHITYSIGPRA